MSKHSEGPWRSGQVETTCGHQWWIWAEHLHGSYKDIASVYHENDARLIAAAPDLYEALVRLHDWVKASNDWLPDTNLGRAVIAALAKASGEQTDG